MQDDFSLKDVTHIGVEPASRKTGETEIYLLKFETEPSAVHFMWWTEPDEKPKDARQNKAEITFTENEKAERVAKAFQRATDLCGAKRSPF